MYHCHLDAEQALMRTNIAVKCTCDTMVMKNIMKLLQEVSYRFVSECKGLFIQSQLRLSHRREPGFRWIDLEKCLKNNITDSCGT